MSCVGGADVDLGAWCEFVTRRRCGQRGSRRVGWLQSAAPQLGAPARLVGLSWDGQLLDTDDEEPVVRECLDLLTMQRPWQSRAGLRVLGVAGGDHQQDAAR